MVCRYGGIVVGCTHPTGFVSVFVGWMESTVLGVLILFGTVDRCDGIVVGCTHPTGISAIILNAKL